LPAATAREDLGLALRRPAKEIGDLVNTKAHMVRALAVRGQEIPDRSWCNRLNELNRSPLGRVRSGKVDQPDAYRIDDLVVDDVNSQHVREGFGARVGILHDYADVIDVLDLSRHAPPDPSRMVCHMTASGIPSTGQPLSLDMTSLDVKRTFASRSCKLRLNCRCSGQPTPNGHEFLCPGPDLAIRVL